jgi:hypothetical protein
MLLLSALAFWPEHAAAQTAAPAKPAPAPKAQSAKPDVARSPTATSEPSAPPKKPDERLSDEAELARVAGLYEAGKYRECSSELERLLDPLGKAPLKQSAIVENARVYWAACLIGAGETDAADAPLRAAIHENSQMKPPDSLVFPPPVVQRFLKVKDSLIDEIRRKEGEKIRQAQAEARARQERLARDRDRMIALEKLARQELLVVRNRRVLAFVPFGVGQIQNRQEALGYALMASEVVLGALSITAIAVQSRRAATADELRRQGKTVDEEAHEQDQATWSTVKTLSAWSFVALAVGGVVHAQIEFVPEFQERRERPLPPALAPSVLPKPRVSAVPYFDAQGGGLSLSGRF